MPFDLDLELGVQASKEEIVKYRAKKKEEEVQSQKPDFS